MHSRLAQAVVAAVALAIASPAAAQERPSEFESWSIPGWTFTPSVSIAGLWDSNIALAANQAEGRRTDADRLFMIEPHGQFDYHGRRTQFTAGYKGYVRRYLDVEQLNGFDQRAFFSIERLLSRRVTLVVRNDFADVPTTDDVQLNGLPYARTGSKSNRLAAEFLARLTRYDDIRVRYENTWVRFDHDSPFLTEGVMNGIRADYGRRLSARTKVGTEYRVRLSNMNNRTRTMWFHDFGGFLEQALSPHVDVELAGGYSVLRDPRLDENRGGAYVRAALTRNTERVMTGVLYERSFAPTFGFGGSSDSHEVRGFVQMPFTRNRIYTRLSAGWRQTNPFLLEELDLDSVYVDSTVGYGAARWLRFEGFHIYARQDSRITGGEVNRHRLGGQVVISQPMRIH